MDPFIVSEESIIRRDFFDVKLDLLERQNGQQIPYTYLITKAEAVSILAKTEDGKYIITREYRHPIKTKILGCPGGRIEENETPVEAAKRELQEETGYTSKNFYPIGKYFPLTGVCDQKIHLFLALKATKEEKINLDPFETIDVYLYSEEEIFNFALAGEKIDGILASLFFYKNIYEKQRE